MTSVWIAEDGTKFTTPKECAKYEMKCRTEIDLNRIEFSGMSGETLSIFNEEDYGYCYSVRIPDEKALKALHEYSSWYCYNDFLDIDSPGEWVYKECHEDDFSFIGFMKIIK